METKKISNANLRLKIVSVVFILLILCLSLFGLFNLTTTKNKDITKMINIQGSPLPPNYFYDKCIQEGAKWNCSDKINSANCCKCNNINETFYLNIGCSLLSPEELCLSSGGNWSSVEGRNENSKSCICQNETTNIGGKCKSL